MSRAALLAIVPYDVVTPPAGFGAPYDAPRWPAGVASAQPECDGWWSLRTAGGVLLHARVLGRNAGGTALALSVHGPAALIRAIADASATAWTIAELRADNTVLATRVKTLLAQRGPATMAGFDDDTAKEDGTE